ncbi:hypothetical protein [Lentzea sp. NBRC 102530]|uniref:hypothetical protein n=1 Tax=Lentzea sp. NBRC 102530 TaxID=3032201 RepID=UPI0024A09785|nr:hypothetical protein [Lentzea sp. NBRC 102530]GLY52352.1 hypothetical protein Lesp01_60080 [Lentzea sp. NBRC 102530]
MTWWRRTLLSLTAATLAAGVVTTPALAAAPAVPTDLKIERRDKPALPCDPASPGTYVNPDGLNDARAVVFSAKVADPEGVEVEYSTWPVGDPAARQSVRVPVLLDGIAYAQVPDWYKVDGTYAWTTKAHDGTSSSAETAPCHLTVDRTRPVAATVTSAVYPPGWTPGGGVGVPGDFTIASTSPDVAQYRYRFSGASDYTYVTPAQLGGPVTVSFTPQNYGYHSLQVDAIDRAGNHPSYSPSYSFNVLENRPMVFSARYPADGTNWEGGIGVPGDFDLSSNLPDVVSYAYRFNDDPEQTVAANAERKARINFTPAKGDFNVLKVQSVSSTGERSVLREHRFKVDSAPRVTFDRFRIGSVTTLTFQSRLPGAVEHRYWFTRWDDTKTEPVVVQAGAGGTATATLTTTVHQLKSLHAVSSDAAGTTSTESYTSISVDGAAPYMTVTGGAHPEEQGTVTFSTSMENPVEYEYWLSYDRATRYKVAAGPDGRATATFTAADALGGQWVIGRVRNAAGIWSIEGSAMFGITNHPDVTSADFPTWPAVAWRSGTFKLKANQPRATEFVYTLDGVTHVTPVGADGTATIEWTPTRAGQIYLVATTRTAAGVGSGNNQYSFTISDAPVVSSAEYRSGQSNTGPLNRPGTFTFTSAVPGVTEYVYSVSRWGTAVVGDTTVAATGGVGTTTYAPASYGTHQVKVAARKADGSLSAYTYYSFDYYSG